VIFNEYLLFESTKKILALSAACVTACIVIAWIVVANFFTVLALLRYKPNIRHLSYDNRKRQAVNYLLRLRNVSFLPILNRVFYSNSLADLLIGLVITPIAFIQDLLFLPLNNLCLPWIGLDITCCTASCVSFMIISLDRWASW